MSYLFDYQQIEQTLSKLAYLQEKNPSVQTIDTLREFERKFMYKYADKNV